MPQSTARYAFVLTAAVWVALLPGVAAMAGPSVFINEFHYDNADVDQNEFIEVAGPAGTDLAGWTIELYSTGTLYDTRALSGTIPEQQAGHGAVAFAYPVNGIQNGPADGMALVNPAGDVVQLLSYEGAFTANSGAANGMTSADVGVAEGQSDPPGQSLQLGGFGYSPLDFYWHFAPRPQTAGGVNTGAQSFLRRLALKMRKLAGYSIFTGPAFVELQMYAAGQTDLAGHRLRLYLPGAILDREFVFGHVALDGTPQRRILVSQTSHDGVTPDYGSGSFRWFGDTPAALCFDDVDCVAWGDFGSTAGLSSPAGTPAPSFDEGQALIRSIAAGCPTYLEAADDTDDSATDFAVVADSTRHNNGSPIPETPCPRIFGDGFESGDFSAWDASATGGGDLSVAEAAAHVDTAFGLQAVVNDRTGLFVQDDTPEDEDRYRARFYFDTNGFDPGESQGRFRTRIFIAFEENPTRRLVALVLRRQNGLYSVMGRARRDDDTQANTGFFPIADGPHFVEIDWLRSSGPRANDGTFRLWIDGTLVSTLIELDNGRSSVDFVRLGALSVKEGAAGTLFWDEFESRRQGMIGP